MLLVGSGAAEWKLCTANRAASNLALSLRIRLEYHVSTASTPSLGSDDLTPKFDWNDLALFGRFLFVGQGVTS